MQNGKGVEIVATGVVHGKDVISAHGEIYNEKHIKKQKYHIIDKSQCTEYNVTNKDIETISKLDKEASNINPNILIAVIESEALKFSLTELWQEYVSEYIFKSKSFPNREMAMEWLKENGIKPNK